jgi:hypothetical protein
MTPISARARRIGVAARLLFLDLARRRVTLILLFVVPALFDVVVLTTSGRRDVEVTIATLVEDGAIIHVSGTAEDPMDPGLLDNGSRNFEERALSLVFLGTTAVCFLACFLAFNLVHKRRDADARLVHAGLPAAELLLAKLLVLAVLVLLLSAYETAAIRPWVSPKHVARLAMGFALGGMVYGCVGLLVGAVAKHELEGIFGIVLFTNIDVGWLQNPVYYSTSERRGFIESLPGHYPTQLAITGAFSDAVPGGSVARSVAYAAAALFLALLAFGWRLRPARPAS